MLALHDGGGPGMFKACTQSERSGSATWFDCRRLPSAAPSYGRRGTQQPESDVGTTPADARPGRLFGPPALLLRMPATPERRMARHAEPPWLEMHKTQPASSGTSESVWTGVFQCNVRATGTVCNRVLGICHTRTRAGSPCRGQPVTLGGADVSGTAEDLAGHDGWVAVRRISTASAPVARLAIACQPLPRRRRHTRPYHPTAPRRYCCLPASPAAALNS